MVEFIFSQIDVLTILWWTLPLKIEIFITKLETGFYIHWQSSLDITNVNKSTCTDKTKQTNKQKQTGIWTNNEYKQKKLVDKECRLQHISLIQLQPLEKGSIEGNHGWLSGLHCTALNLWQRQTKPWVITDYSSCIHLYGTDNTGSPTKRNAPVLSQYVACGGHYCSFVRDHANDLYKTTQLLFKLGKKWSRLDFNTTILLFTKVKIFQIL